MEISVVTVCRNAEPTIGFAIESFLRQTHRDKELVVIDGASSDRTVAIARSFAGEAVRTMSEPDAGIYDAMNKGLNAFTGECVGFLNADDRFHDPEALATIAQALDEADICYGDLDFVRREAPRVIRRWRSTSWRRGAFRAGWMPPHPTFYCRRAVVEQVGGFDLNYRLAADYDFMLRAMEMTDFRSAQIHRTLVTMTLGGASTSSFGAVLRHSREALASRQRWLGAGLLDYALFAKPLRKLGQLLPTNN